MRGVDANILVRFFANDHPERAEAARAVMAAGDIFIATTVLLEFKWVMRSAYKRSAAAVLRALAALAGMRGVTVENPEMLAQAITLARDGMDFADALHVAGAEARGCEAFVTFDQALVRAGGKGAVRVVEVG